MWDIELSKLGLIVKKRINFVSYWKNTVLFRFNNLFFVNLLVIIDDISRIC